MRVFSFIVSAALSVSLSLATYAQTPSQTQVTPSVKWEVQGFPMPESVDFDERRQRYYVSNVNGEPMGVDHNGSLGWIAEDGSDYQVGWITGMSSPKGIALKGDYLYVADTHELVVVNVETEVITARYPVPNSGMLNDVTVTHHGDVFVSDWAGNAIYRLNGQELSLWLASDALQSPNGLFARNGYLYVGAWGEGARADFTTETTGSLKRIALHTKRIETLSDGSEWMNLDGIAPIRHQQWLATDFIAGDLLHLNRHGNIERRIMLEPSLADFYYDAYANTLVVPYLMGNKVVAYDYDAHVR